MPSQFNSKAPFLRKRVLLPPIILRFITMEEFHIIRLPIVHDGKLAGIVSRGDVLRSLIEPEFVTHMQ